MRRPSPRGHRPGPPGCRGRTPGAREHLASHHPWEPAPPRGSGAEEPVCSHPPRCAAPVTSLTAPRCQHVASVLSPELFCRLCRVSVAKWPRQTRHREVLGRTAFLTGEEAEGPASAAGITPPGPQSLPGADTGPSACTHPSRAAPEGPRALPTGDRRSSAGPGATGRTRVSRTEEHAGSVTGGQMLCTRGHEDSASRRGGAPGPCPHPHVAARGGRKSARERPPQ